MLRRPDPSRPVGDVIPFFDAIERRYHLFYLSPLRDEDSFDERLAGVQWEHISSTDLRQWTRHSPALLADSPGIDTGGALTGCVIRAGDQWFLFYSGSDPDAAWPQTINVATSVDLTDFTKLPGNPIVVPPGSGFEQNDWRDPYVFWNESAGEYWMLISARQDDGPSARRGVIAVATSPDLQAWTVRDRPFIAPWTTLVPECPDLTRFGDQWVLSFSAYTGPPGIHYFRSDSPSGPWTPTVGHTDGAGWYAGKSMSDGDRVLAFAWIPDRVTRADGGEMLWGGDFATPRELWMDDEGTMGHRLPAEILASLEGELTQLPSFVVASSNPLAIQPLDVASRAGATLLTFTIEWGEATGTAGVFIRASDALDSGLMLAISPATRRVELVELSDEWTHMVDRPFGPWVAHTALRDLRTTSVQVIIDGSCIEVFVDDQMSLSHRYYGDGSPLSLALFAQFAEASFVDIRVSGEVVEPVRSLEASTTSSAD